MKRFVILLVLSGGCSAFECPLMEEAGETPRRPERKDEPKALFDGKSLAGWKVTEYGGQGDVSVKDGEITVAMGAALSGITWSGTDFPKTNYEVSLEMLKVDGDDICCGIAFPVGETHCSFVCGGWGGQIVGLSSVDEANADGNDTTKVMEFKKNQWYRIRLRVTPAKIETWIGDKQMVSQELKEHKIGIHPAMELAKPFGIATYTTTSKFKNITLKKLP
jgi:hypothetical protein